YGLPLPGSATLSRVTLGTDLRGGALGLGSILAMNSTPVRPSVVLRGRWALMQLLCAEPGPPPAAFQVPASEPGKTPRQQLEEHRKNPSCAACHSLMDPIGFGLDHYDADGSWRTVDRGGLAIDATG